jgi:DNA repair protein RadA/Sms
VIYLKVIRAGKFALRATKNRFGATDEVGVFEMTDKGLIELANPSHLFLSHRVAPLAGSAVVVTLEGTRPLLVEIQALVVPTQLAMPRRVGQGVDYNRLQLIGAVLSKRLGLPLGGYDLYVNVTGGLTIREPAADVGIALAILSSFKNKPLVKNWRVWRVGTLGEIRPVRRWPNAPKRRAGSAYPNHITGKYASIGKSFVGEITFGL